MKMFINALPPNYTPAKPMSGCGPNAVMKGFKCTARNFAQKPSGLGMNMLGEMMDAMFAAKHNERAKGVEIERVGKESEMNQLLENISKGITS